MPGKPMPVPDRPRTELLLSLPALRARLQEQRQFRIEQIAALGAGLDGAAGRDGATTAPATAERDGGSAQDQVAAALLTGARQALADIETALYRIGNGEYGNCLQCRRPIDMRRLRTLPQTALCVDCHRARATGPAGAPQVADRHDVAPATWTC